MVIFSIWFFCESIYSYLLSLFDIYTISLTISLSPKFCKKSISKPYSSVFYKILLLFFSVEIFIFFIYKGCYYFIFNLSFYPDSDYSILHKFYKELFYLFKVLLLLEFLSKNFIFRLLFSLIWFGLKLYIFCISTN
jgi:hypothetical protein